MVDIFCGYFKIGLFWGSFLYILVPRYRMGIFLGAAKFQIFLGMPDIPDIFGR